MKILDDHASGFRAYYTVVSESGDLVSDSGKTLDSSHYIGTIDAATGKTRFWKLDRRSFNDSAQNLLEEARQQLIADGRVKGKPRHPEAKYHRGAISSHRGDHNNYVQAYGGSKRDAYAQAKEELDGLGVSLRRKGGEYCVTLQDGSSGEVYCTDDLGDAVAVGTEMGVEHAKRQRTHR